MLDTSMAGGSWYALHVRQRYEKTTAQILRGKGYREFLPLYRMRRRWSDRIVEVELPLFPGYVFCHFDLSDRRVPIISTPGVIQIVGVGRLPVAVEDSEIAAIQQVIESGIAAEPWPYLKAGQRVRIEHGALAGLEGIFIEAKKRHRLVVSVTLLQRSVAVEIDSAWATPLGPNWRAGLALPQPAVPAARPLRG
jgi:transcription antitermination factor NusG